MQSFAVCWRWQVAQFGVDALPLVPRETNSVTRFWAGPKLQILVAPDSAGGWSRRGLLQVSEGTCVSCMIRLPAEGTEGIVACWVARQGCSLDARVKGVPLHGAIDGGLLPEEPLIVQPHASSVPLCLPDHQTCVGQQTTRLHVCDLHPDVG